jgi:hypothetical protein
MEDDAEPGPERPEVTLVPKHHLIVVILVGMRDWGTITTTRIVRGFIEWGDFTNQKIRGLCPLTI